MTLYRNAACLVVALHPNAHAGGVTTVLEGAAIGTPVVVADTGGLDAYFDEDEVAFVPTEDAVALRDRISELVEDAVAAKALGDRGRARFESARYTNDAYWERIGACLEADPELARAAEASLPPQDDGIFSRESSQTLPDHTLPFPSSHLATGP